MTDLNFIDMKHLEKMCDAPMTSCPFGVNNLKIGCEEIDSDIEVKEMVEPIGSLLEE